VLKFRHKVTQERPVAEVFQREPPWPVDVAQLLGLRQTEWMTEVEAVRTQPSLDAIGLLCLAGNRSRLGLDIFGLRRSR